MGAAAVMLARIALVVQPQGHASCDQTDRMHQAARRFLRYRWIVMTLAQDPPAFLARGEQFEIVFRTAPMGLILVGLDGRMLLVNPAMCRIVGFTEAELLERTVQDITHPDDRALTQQWLLRMQREPEETLQLDKRYLH